MKILVLGAGRVGATIARDLAAEPAFAVTAADRSADALAPLAAGGLATRVADLADPAAIGRLVAEFDLVAGALPSFLGFAALGAVIEAGKPVVDISFFAEDPFRWDELARRRGVTAVVDCGIAPGVSNLLLGRMIAALARVDRFVCYVGGLPAVRRKPFEYKAPFAPYDVIEEYVRPARQRIAGATVELEALSEVEHLDFDEVGTLEAFNTDGLRTLLVTTDVRELREKTMRYPGHADLMRLFRDAGFFDPRPIGVRGAAVRPLDVTSEILFRHWRFAPGEEDVTVMRVEVEGEDRDGARVRHRFDLLDRYDAATATPSMSRTTGYAATAAVRLVAAGRFAQPGIHPPEHLGGDEALYDAFMAHLESRGVRFRHTVERPA